MVDVVRAILKKLGINLADVVIKEELNGLMIPTNNWYIRFVYNNYKHEIQLDGLGTKEMYMWLFRYDYSDTSKIEEHHAVGLADITAEELYKVIEDFINRKEVE